MNQSKILITVLLALLLLGGGFYLWKIKTMKQEVLPVSEDLPGETMTDPVDAALDTSDWKTYRNEQYGFELKYPAVYIIEENDQWNQTTPYFQVVFLDQEKESRQFFGVRVSYLANQVPGESMSVYLDYPAVSQGILGGEKANIFILDKGYCDGPSCSRPIVALITEYNNESYTLDFHDMGHLAHPTVNAIWKSFHFTK